MALFFTETYSIPCHNRKKVQAPCLPALATPFLEQSSSAVHTHATKALTLKSWENGSYPSSTGYLGTRMTEMVPGLQRPVRRKQIPKSNIEIA